MIPRPWLLLALLCCGWTQPISWRYPTTNTDGTPLTDLDHAEITLRQCNGDSLRLPNVPATGMEGDSAALDLSILDTIYHLTIELRAVDHSGNRGPYQSINVVHQFAETPPPPPDTTTTGIMGTYYNGRFRNTFINTRRDSTIDFQWGLGSPMTGVRADSFSVQWNGKIIIPTAGSWTFYIQVDDGAQLFEGVPFASNLRIDKLITQPLTELAWTGNLIAGEHGLSIIYMADAGNSQITLRIAGPGFPKQTVPRSWLR